MKTKLLVSLLVCTVSIHTVVILLTFMCLEIQYILRWAEDKATWGNAVVTFEP
jgi:hypothetical protein